MSTFNLHMTSQHLHEQETQTGAVRATAEWWVERGIQGLKACTTNGKLTRDPEKLIVNILLLERALVDRAREYPQYAHIVGLGESPPPSEFKGYADKGDERSGELLLHVGKPVKLSDEGWQGLRAVAEGMGVALEIEKCKAYRFTAAKTAHGVIHSKAHTRTVSRESWHVELDVQLKAGFKSRRCYADVLRFVKVDLGGGADGSLRAAEVVVFTGPVKELDGGAKLIDDAEKHKRIMYVSLSSLGRKVIFARDEAKPSKIFVLPSYTGRL